MPHVLYLTHDLNDAATWRRIDMLRRGGARVTLAGFHRGPPPAATAALAVVPLGGTANGRMLQRARAVAQAFATLGGHLRGVDAPDVILARNLEMLALAPRARTLFRAERPRLVYECLDIHRMMLGTSPRARLMRAVERALVRSASLVLTSSPAFVRAYFRPLAQIDTPIRIVENRTPLPAAAPAAPPPPGEAGLIRIGWFGILRCGTSLDCLDRVTRAHPGRISVILRGRPALDVVPRFHEVVANNPDLDFGGPYVPEDLCGLYGGVHYAWLIDRYEAGQNSEWLLPNRLYEGGAYGAVPIALRGTETAAFLARRGLGLRLSAATPEALATALLPVSPAGWTALNAAMRAQPVGTWAYDTADCAELVAVIAGTTRGIIMPEGALHEVTT